MNRSQITVTGAVASAVLLVGSFFAWPKAGASAQTRAAAIVVSEHSSWMPRCGGESAAVAPAIQLPLPNAYMAVNGSVFSLADLFACARQLHTARLS